jgi:hypothetical protein
LLRYCDSTLVDISRVGMSSAWRVGIWHVDPGQLKPLAQVPDGFASWRKLKTLTKSMGRHGWVGSYLVIDRRQALNGSHRLEAARRTGTLVPVMDVRTLCQQAGVSWSDELAASDGQVIRARTLLVERGVLPHDILGS